MHKREKKQNLKFMKSGKRPSFTKKFIKAGMQILLPAACLFLLKQGHALFTVKEIKVSGSAYLERNEILEISGIEKGSSIFLLQRKKAVQRLLTEPAVLSADISKSYPSTVVITLNGRTPSAYILSEGDCWIVDEKGIIYGQSSGIQESLPIVTGVDPEQLVLGLPLQDPVLAKALEAFVVALAAVPDLEAAELNLTNSQEMVLYTASGLKVLLGDSGKMKQKLMLLRETLPYLSDVGSGSCLDVRTGDRLVVYGQVF